MSAGLGGIVSIFQGVAGIGSAVAQQKFSEAESTAQKAQAEYQAKMLELNAGYIEDQKDDIVKLGEMAAGQAVSKGERVVGAQKAAAAAQGISISSGSVADIAAETRTLAAVDAYNIRNNAWREAFGYKMQALDLRSQARVTRIAGEQASKMTLLTGGMKSAGMWAEGIGNIAGGGISMVSDYYKNRKPKNELLSEKATTATSSPFFDPSTYA